jgi:intein/homing endonuclease
MKGTLFSADFVKDSNDNLRLLELNTDTSIVKNELSNLNLIEFVNILQTNNIIELDIIYKPVIHSHIVTHISNYITENCEFITNINLHDENFNTIYPTQVEDSTNKFILRLAYDESALFDSEYCKNRLNVYNLFSENSITDYCVGYYHSSSLGEFDTLTREENSSNIPDATIKDINEHFNPIDFFKVNTSEGSIEENWNSFVNQNSSEDKLIEQYHFHSSSVDGNNHITSIRFIGIVYGSNLDFVELASFKKSAIFELPSSIDLDSETNKLKDYHFYQFVTNMFKYDSSGILSSHEVLMENDTWKEISDIEVGDYVKSYYISGSLKNESDIVLIDNTFDGNQFPTGSYVTSSLAVYKNTENLKYNSMIEMVVDNDSLFAGIGKGYLVYDSLTDKTSFKSIANVNATTDYLYDIDGGLVKVDEINFYISSDDNLSFVELDVEDTDTYIINGSTAFNSLITHNAPCFVAGTPILMEDETHLNIENVKVGDRVLSFDFKNNESKPSNVLNIFSKKVNKVVKYTFESGKELIATIDHPIYAIDKGWASYSDDLSNILYNLEKPVNKLEIGDVIKLYNKTEVLTCIEIIEGEHIVYNLSEVETYHNYYADYVLVHNRRPPPPGLVCFIAGTKVTMEDGSEKNIEDVVIDDVVLSYNENSRCIEPKKVVKLESPIHDDLVEYTLTNGTTITSTFDHPYYVNGLQLASYKPNWTNSRYDLPSTVIEIKVGDLLNLVNNEVVEIVSIKELDRVDVQTYIFSVEDNRNFYANGILVHNK